MNKITNIFFNNRVLNNRVLNNRVLNNRVLNNRVLNNRVLNNRVLNNRVLNNRVLNNRELNSRELNSRELNSRELNNSIFLKNNNNTCDFLKPKDLYRELNNKGINKYFGVYNSELNNYLKYLYKNNKIQFMTNNEIDAISMAAGYNISSDNIPCVYLQNSNIGRIIDPLLSFKNSIPMLVIIQWNEEQLKNFETKYIVNHQLSPSLFNQIGIENTVLNNNINIIKKQINFAYNYMTDTSSPFCFIINKNTYKNTSCKNTYKNNNLINSGNIITEEAIKIILNKLLSFNEKYSIISTKCFVNNNLHIFQKFEKNLYIIDSSNNLNAFVRGLSINNNFKKLVCIYDNNDILINLGNMLSNLKHNNNNIYIFINTSSNKLIYNRNIEQCDNNLSIIFNNYNYKHYYKFDNYNCLINFFDNKYKNIDAPIFIEFKLNYHIW